MEMEVEPRYIKDDVKINRFKLEEECDIHPSIYHYWAEKLSEAKADADHLAAREKYVRAKVARDLRENPPNGKKLTDSGVNEATEMDEEVQHAIKAANESKRLKYKLEAAVEAMNNRKRELDNLVDLYIRGFYQQGHGGRKPSTDDVQLAHRQKLNSKRQNKSEEDDQA